MIAKNINDIKLYTFEKLSKFENVKHFVSSRFGGVSPEPLDSLNISFETPDIAENVIENRKRLSLAVDIPLESFVMQNQVHGNIVKLIAENDKGKGVYDHKTVVGNHDAMITDKKGICLFLFAADCVPLLFYDPEKNAIGAAHAGWQGTLKKIAQKTAEAMKNEFNTKFDNLIVSVGPSISVKNYEVSDDFIQKVENAFGTTENYLIKNIETGRVHLDLWYSNKKQLLDIGIKEENIELANICTFDNPDFFSARENRNSGRFGAGIMLR